MAKFAEGTEVPAERSRAEIEKTLTRFGADQFMYGWKGEGAAIAFHAKGRHIRFTLPMPKPSDVARTGRGNTRTGAALDLAMDQEIRRRWRALALCIKAKLESVATGIETFEDSFMAHMILPNGQSMAEHVHPLLEQAYRDGKMPPLLPHIRASDSSASGGGQ